MSLSSHTKTSLYPAASDVGILASPVSTFRTLTYNPGLVRCTLLGHDATVRAERPQLRFTPWVGERKRKAEAPWPDDDGMRGLSLLPLAPLPSQGNAPRNEVWEAALGKVPLVD